MQHLSRAWGFFYSSLYDQLSKDVQSPSSFRPYETCRTLFYFDFFKLLRYVEKFRPQLDFIEPSFCVY